MNASDIKNEILAYLEENYAVRTTELIEEIKKKHTSLEGLVDRGFNEKSFYRKIKEMKEDGQILEIESGFYDIYGIKDPDARSKYLVSKIVDERRKHIDQILPYLKSKDPGDVIVTLDEIDRYRGKYHLNSTQLNEVIHGLDYDITIAEKTVWILYYYMGNQKIFPSNHDLLIKKLRSALIRFCRTDVTRPNILQYLLYLLGMLKDPSVVEQLIFDAKSLERLIRVSGLYRNKDTAEPIEMQRDVLFEFERKLRKTKSAENSEIANIISEIRTQAASLLLSPQNSGGWMS